MNTATKQHPRLRTFDEPNECLQNRLTVIVLKDDRKLRGHVLEHLFDNYEWEKVWKRNTSTFRNPKEDLSVELGKIGCPYAGPHDGQIRHLCESCTLFEQCSVATHISEAEKMYVEAILKLISEALTKPRFVTFFSNRNNTNCMMAFHDNWVKIVGDYSPAASAYDVRTAFVFGGPYQTNEFQEALKDVAYHVRQEAQRGSCNWCNETTWSLDNNSNPEQFEESKRRRSRKYKRSEEKSAWKKYLLPGPEEV